MKPSKDLDEILNHLMQYSFDYGKGKISPISNDPPLIVARQAKQQLLALIEQTKKSYGGCEKCYGKGYATVSSRWTANDTDTDIGSPGGRYSGGKDFEMKFCDCERGTQLGKLIEQREREARIAELNRIAVAVEDRRTADSFDGRVYVTKLSNIDDRIQALQKGAREL